MKQTTKPEGLTWYDEMVAAKSMSKANLAAIQTMEQMKRTAQAITAVKDQPNPKKFHAGEHDKIRQFIGLIQSGLENWTEAGKMLVELQMEDPDIKIKIRREDPRITLPFLDKLESIGLGKLNAEAFMLPISQQRTIGMLPPAVQSNLLSGSVPVVKQHNGDFVQEAKRLEEMTQKEFKQSISLKGPVPVREQIEHIKREEIRQKAYEARWIFEDGWVVFLRKCRLDVETLKSILARLESIKPDASVIESEIKRRQVVKK